MKGGKAVVVFSGGQDSTTCLGWAINRFEEVYPIHFRYGQKHAVETAVSRDIAAHLGLTLIEVDLEFLPGIVVSALTSSGDVNQRHPQHPDLPSSFVPNRNALFLTLAHAYAQTVGARAVITGVCETDYSGYPDCRRKFINAINRALNLGSDSDIVILTPLMARDKKQIFGMAEKEGVLEIVLELSHTCYNGERRKYDWGRGCGECPACNLRKKGWEEYARGRR